MPEHACCTCRCTSSCAPADTSLHAPAVLLWLQPKILPLKSITLQKLEEMEVSGMQGVAQVWCQGAAMLSRPGPRLPCIRLGQLMVAPINNRVCCCKFSAGQDCGAEQAAAGAAHDLRLSSDGQREGVVNTQRPVQLSFDKYLVNKPRSAA